MRGTTNLSTAIRTIGAGLLILCGVSVVVFVGLDYVSSVGKGAQRNCLLGGSSHLTAEQIERVLSPGEPLEALMPTGSYTLVPMGLACDYPLADGTGSIRLVSGSWAETVGVGVLAVGAGLGGIMLAIGRVRPSADR